MLDLSIVGTKYKNTEKKKNMSQDELAEILFITRKAVSKWENGISAPTIDSLLSLCKLFETSFEDILC